jgi:biotin operon repressor
VTYESGAAAAEALGLDKTAIYKAQKRGCLENVGLGLPGYRVKKGERIADKPVRVQGVTYPSQKIAAEVLGVSRATIYRAKKKGRARDG